MIDVQGEQPNNPWINKDLTIQEFKDLQSMTETAGWKLFMQIKAYSNMGAVRDVMNLEREGKMRDAAVGVWSATSADLQFAEDVVDCMDAEILKKTNG